VNRKREGAVVVGASIAGLLAARVLADHFAGVTLIERDALPATPSARRGAPQARHTHALLVRGRLILEGLFPGLIDELIADGAVLFDSGADSAFMSPLGWLPRFPTGLMTVACSRDLLEWHIRRRLAMLPNVRFIQDTEVTGLIPAQYGRRAGVAGVTVRPRGAGLGFTAGEPASATLIPADLVVDASGRGSHAPDWLAGLGIRRPRETLVNSYLAYATRTYAVPDFERDWKVATIQAQPPDLTRAGVILPIEGGRWMVTLAGYCRDYPPLDDAGFIDYAQSLAHPLIVQAIQRARPLTPIVGYRRTENYMRHYEELPIWPDGLAVTGDAVCGFNPIYGQGMTNAAIGATILAGVLRRSDSHYAARFQKMLARHNATPWLLATNEDFRFPATEGDRPGRGTWLVQRYLDRVIIASLTRRDVLLAFFAVAHMVAGPASLFRPAVVARVLWHALTHRGAGAGTEMPTSSMEVPNAIPEPAGRTPRR
jgi:2-polyprenyl-6-methoxyphenol hydroxylase-like FAD-dependent oxidoreductase